MEVMRLELLGTVTQICLSLSLSSHYNNVILLSTINILSIHIKMLLKIMAAMFDFYHTLARGLMDLDK
jgi:hypothetical protein